jgi:hypothetical protein
MHRHEALEFYICVHGVRIYVCTHILYSTEKCTVRNLKLHCVLVLVM